MCNVHILCVYYNVFLYDYVCMPVQDCIVLCMEAVDGTDMVE